MIETAATGLILVRTDLGVDPDGGGLAFPAGMPGLLCPITILFSPAVSGRQIR
jgi:hypothetical protein